MRVLSGRTGWAQLTKIGLSQLTQQNHEKTQDLDGNHGEVQQTLNEEKTVSREKWIDDQQPELIYPTKLTEQEREDITQQIWGLPVDVAQQMLDVVETQIRSGQIRTNPAAMLRGIVRKYQTDPSHFDPSSGFQIAAQRRRQAAMELHQRQVEEMRLKRLEEAAAAACATRQAPRGRSEGQRQFVEGAMQALRGASRP
jgi:hypothetical protein